MILRLASAGSGLRFGLDEEVTVDPAAAVDGLYTAGERVYRQGRGPNLQSVACSVQDAAFGHAKSSGHVVKETPASVVAQLLARPGTPTNLTCR